MCIRLFSLPQSLLHRELTHIIQKRDSLLLAIPFCNSSSGLLTITAIMYLWNLPESIGSLLLTFLKDIVHITVANPKWVKAIKGNKDDVKDPKWIDGLSHFGLVP
jgi:hypothetical protein